MTDPCRLRSATTADRALIVEMARHACVIEDWPLPEEDSDDVRSLLPGRDDIEVVATTASGNGIGAAWTFHHEPPLPIAGYGVVPEIVIAVAPTFRNEGVGATLLAELIVRSTNRCEALSLNVHQRNPAGNLYQRLGFRPVGQGRGPLGVAMLKNLP